MLLQGKNAVITGARRGIGRSTVEVFAAHGANVWALARAQDADFAADMASIAARYGTEIHPLYAELTEEPAIKAAVKKLRQECASIDVLVNVAGMADASSSFCMSSIDRMRHVFDVNFWSMTVLTQYVPRLMMRKRAGSIVNLASIAGLDGTPGQYEYCASKAAIIGGTKYLARELGSYNIRVNAVAPGIVDTDMGGQIADDLRAKTLATVTAGRVGTPAEIAGVIAFLASDAASYMTGQVVRVDGGM